MRIWFLSTALFGMAMAGTVGAQTCSTTTYSYPLVNGAAASAPQVMADLDCAPIHGLANWAGNVGVGTTAPSALLSLGSAITTIKLAAYDGGPSSLYGMGVNNGELTFGAGIAATGTPQMVLTGAGLVGVGTTSPAMPLDVEGSSVGYGIKVGNSSGNYGSIFDDGNFHISSSSAPLWINTSDNSSPVTINGQSNGNVILTNGAGLVGIGTNSPNYRLTVNGTVYATGGAGALSDLRHKDNIHSLPDGALDLVAKLRPVTFTWKRPTDPGMGGEQIGFIAQEVEPVVPDVVLTQPDADKTKALKYDQLIPLLTKAIQEQQAEITSLRTEVADLKAKLSTQARSSPAP